MNFNFTLHIHIIRNENGQKHHIDIPTSFPMSTTPSRPQVQADRRRLLGKQQPGRPPHLLEERQRDGLLHAGPGQR